MTPETVYQRFRKKRITTVTHLEYDKYCIYSHKSKNFGQTFRAGNDLYTDHKIKTLPAWSMSYALCNPKPMWPNTAGNHQECYLLKKTWKTLPWLRYSNDEMDVEMTVGCVTCEGWIHTLMSAVRRHCCLPSTLNAQTRTRHQRWQWGKGREEAWGSCLPPPSHYSHNCYVGL